VGKKRGGHAFPDALRNAVLEKGRKERRALIVAQGEKGVSSGACFSVLGQRGRGRGGKGRVTEEKGGRRA